MNTRLLFVTIFFLLFTFIVFSQDSDVHKNKEGSGTDGIGAILKQLFEIDARLDKLEESIPKARDPKLHSTSVYASPGAMIWG